MYTDAHCHLYDLYQIGKTKAPKAADVCCACLERYNFALAASAHDKSEFAFHEELRRRLPQNVYTTFGIHPQKPDKENAAFLEELAAAGRICAVGECGFDLFTPEYASLLDAQLEVWRIQLELALKYSLPIVVHCRKGTPYIFKDVSILKKLPAVVFHSWSGSPIEADSLLKRGVNAFFSFGNSLLQGNKRARAAAAAVPLKRLLTETDAPYQRLKGRAYTACADLAEILECAASLRGIPIETLKTEIRKNALDCFCGR